MWGGLRGRHNRTVVVGQLCVSKRQYTPTNWRTSATHKSAYTQNRGHAGAQLNTRTMETVKEQTGTVERMGPRKTNGDSELRNAPSTLDVVHEHIEKASGHTYSAHRFQSSHITLMYRSALVYLWVRAFSFSSNFIIDVCWRTTLNSSECLWVNKGKFGAAQR